MVALEATFLVEKLKCVIVHNISPLKGIIFSIMSSFQIHSGDTVMERRQVFSTCSTCMVGSCNTCLGQEQPV